MSFLQQFLTFLKTFGVIGLALAFVLGQASSNLVNSLVDDIINPFIGLFLPSGNLDAVHFVIYKSDFKIGSLISNIITFTIMALIIFVAYKFLSSLKLVEDATKKKT